MCSGDSISLYTRHDTKWCCKLIITSMVDYKHNNIADSRLNSSIDWKNRSMHNISFRFHFFLICDLFSRSIFPKWHFPTIPVHHCPTSLSIISNSIRCEFPDDEIYVIRYDMICWRVALSIENVTKENIQTIYRCYHYYECCCCCP